VTVTPFGRASPLDIHTRSVGEGEATIVANNDDLNYKDLVSQFIVKRPNDDRTSRFVPI